MEILHIKDYEIVLYGRQDGSSYDLHHHAHQTFYSIRQIHEPILHHVTEKKVGQDRTLAGDALMSSVASLGVHIADCLPIAFLGKTWYAVVHGSWKTLQTQILQKTVKNLCRHGEDVVDMFVYIGPSIRTASYEVGGEFVDYFPSTYLHTKGDKYLLDMLGYTIDSCIGLGIPVRSIAWHEDDTYVHHEKRRSWRQGAHQGRNFMGVRRVI